MRNQAPTRKVPLPAPALIAVLAVAGGCIAPGPESDPGDNAALTPAAASADDAGGLPTKGDGGGVGSKDAGGGIGTKGDSGGIGTKQDSGSGAADAGVVQDAGGMTTPDAGGELGACFACAEQHGCKVQV